MLVQAAPAEEFTTAAVIMRARWDARNAAAFSKWPTTPLAPARVIYCLEPPGADTYIFGVRLRPDGSFDEGDDPPETDG